MRRRLTVAIAGVAAVAVVLFAVPLSLVLGSAHRSADLARLQRDTFAATRGIDVSAGGDPVELPASRDSLGVYDARGRLVAGRGPRSAPAVVRRALRRQRSSTDPAGSALVVAVPLVAGERVSGAVLAHRAQGEASGDTTEQRLAVAGLAVAIVAAAALAAAALGRTLARPLERLATAAQRLGDGDFGVRPPAAGIPEVDAVGSALMATAARLDELVSRERAFSADASHQLRTPLQALRLDLEAASLRGGAPPEVALALEQADRLERTIATLLAVARDAPRRAGRANLGPLLDGLAARWHGPLAAASRRLLVPGPDGHLTAAADPRVVDQVLDVLVHNAARHGAGTVRVDVRRLGDWLALDVADEGPGFDVPSERAFTRRDADGGGHGIGLALARSLAHAEGGRLTVSRGAPAPVVTLFLRAAPDPTTRPTSVLVVLDRIAAERPLLDALRERATHGPARFFVVVPAPAPGLPRWWRHDRRDARADAERALLRLLPSLQDVVGDAVRGRVSPRRDLVDTVEDTLNDEPFDELMLCVEATGLSQRLAGLGLPLTTVPARRGRPRPA